MQAQLFQLSIVSRYVPKIRLNKQIVNIIFPILECVCNPNGSTTLECGKNNGACSCIEGYAGVKCQKCMPHVVGDKCDTCKPSFFDFPSCQEGLSMNLFLN